MQCGENMSDTDQTEDMPPVPPGTEPKPETVDPTEPTIDHSMFRMELGKVEDLIAHLKDWVRWHLKQG